MTGITVYQGLLDSPCLSLRKFALRRLMALETSLYGHEAHSLTIRGTMGHEESGDGRGTVYARLSGTVNATTVRASDRLRIRDSHDARPAAERQTWRNVSRDTPYGDEWRMRDDLPMGEGLAPADKCGDCVTTRVPVWAVSLPDEERGKLATVVSVKPALRLSDVKPPRRTARSVIAADVSRAMRQREAAARVGNLRWHHDFTQG